MSSCKKTRTFACALWRKNLLECHAAPAHEPLVPPIRKKVKDGSSKSLLALRHSFPSPSPSCARFALSNFSSMTRTDVQDQCRIIRRCCCCSLTTAKRCRSCWWPSRVVVILLPSTASKSADCVPPYGRTYLKKKHVPPYGGE